MVADAAAAAGSGRSPSSATMWTTRRAKWPQRSRGRLAAHAFDYDDVDVDDFDVVDDDDGCTSRRCCSLRRPRRQRRHLQPPPSSFDHPKRAA